MWDLIGCEKELGLVKNTKSSGSGNTNLCIIDSFVVNLPNLIAVGHKSTTTTSSLPILPARFCDFLTCWSSKILPQFFSDSRRNFCDVTFLLFVELAFWDLVLKHGYKGYKTGREVHKKLRIFSKRNESFTTTLEFAKFWGVSQTNFEDKFLYFSIVEIFHALMTVLLWFSLIQLRFLAILLYLWNRQLWEKQNKFL